MRILCAARAWELTLIRWFFAAVAVCLASISPSALGSEKKTLTLAFITQRSLTSQWSVEVSLDGARIGRETFQLEP